MDEAGIEIGLNEVPNGGRAEILALKDTRTVNGRLAAFGFVPGATVYVIQNYSYAPLIVAVASARVAVGRGEAGKIRARRVV
ncbi:MAG TPA: FeoA family protein [Anaerolineae bacterium]